MNNPPRVTVWNEYLHEKQNEAIARIYPGGMHAAIATHLQQAGFPTRTATLEEPEHGLDDHSLRETDVLLWWGHLAHERVSDDVIERVYQRVVRDGMGLIVLHSAHFSRIFIRLMGTTCELKWREAAEQEKIWTVAPGHPITRGLPECIELEQTEMYGEHFDIPAPDQLVFISSFAGGEVFRSGCCFYRGHGKIFYFRPGHETYPIYHNAHVLQVIANAVHWAAPSDGPANNFGHTPLLE